jgi:sugar O-acyltransferase (sialic acid O-acetyltransferase NeuD family)
MKKLILVGGGGHCKSCIDVIESTKEYEIVGILEKNTDNQTHILGYPILGNDDLIPTLANEGYEFLITVGQIKSADIRIKIFDFIKKSGGRLATIIAPTAYVSQYATIGEGTIIMHQAFVNAEVTVGNNCLINTKATLEHEVNVGNHCHISVNAVLNGAVIIHDNCFIGSSAVLYQCVSIMPNTLIGAGSVVSKSLKSEGVYVGNPLKKIG